jgi:hypothetical protein
MHGLYLLWWVQEKHVPVPVVATLLAAGDLAITALEIPTGWLADRFGHRISLIAGALTQAAGMVLCWLGEGVVGLLSAILLVALGDTLRSGADQALLYRSCLALEREPDFQSIESRSRSLQLVALVAFILAGGAKAANIFWQVGSSATLGTGSSFNGNILAQDSITVTTGAALNGRALARTGAVTLDTNVVTSPGGPGAGFPPPTPAPSSLILVAIGLGCAALYQARERLRRPLSKV